MFRRSLQIKTMNVNQCKNDNTNVMRLTGEYLENPLTHQFCQTIAISPYGYQMAIKTSD